MCKIFILIITAIGMYGCQAEPEELRYETNYLKGLELGFKENKPILIHFTGFGCVGYNEFTNDLIISQKIQNKLNEEFITIQLYVDDEKSIEMSDTLNLHKFNFSEEGREVIEKARTIGNINMAIEIGLFGRRNQPLYIIIDSKRNMLVEPFEYTGKDKTYFMEKLNEGLGKFREKQK